jgi:hypothetical protein
MQNYAHVQAESLRRAVGVLDRIGLEGKGVFTIIISGTQGFRYLRYRSGRINGKRKMR